MMYGGVAPLVKKHLFKKDYKEMNSVILISAMENRVAIAQSRIL